MRRIHNHSVRLRSGAEALVTRVVGEDGAIGFGFSLELDATGSRHMAEANAGIRPGEKRALPPEIEALAATIRWEDK